MLGRTGRFDFFSKSTVSAHVRRFHMYVTGLAGREKSRLIQDCLLQDIRGPAHQRQVSTLPAP
ncbi:MAG TPA: hypothetical protein VLL49_04605 [Anaerolineales bacterium]|nr:hypothetical protein [Anaerolineales bacterium]